ncbi:hypothetical protein DLE01_03935, partial [Streptomyces sp. FT05W]
MTVRLTWVQPEDLVGHELRQAAQDGRDARDIERRWLSAGGGLGVQEEAAAVGLLRDVPQDAVLPQGGVQQDTVAVAVLRDVP